MRSRLAIALIVLLTLAACGQKPGVENQLAGGLLPPGATINEQGQVVDAQGNVIGSVDDLGSGGNFGGGVSTDTGTTTAEGSSEDTAGGGSAPPGSGTAPQGPGTTTGVSNTIIKIGSHAPLTGAAPVPSDSAQKGIDVFWKWSKENRKDIHGRYVDAILKNDNYNPSQAVAVCKEMVEKDGVFLLGGLAGNDQIQACARYAASVGVPYLSAGVTELGLTDLPNYFTTSMTYADQGPLLVDFMINKLGAKGEKNGMLRFDTPNFEDAHDAFIDAAASKGLKIHYDRAVCKCASSTEAQTVVQEMKAAGIENVYVLVSPVWWLQVLQASRTQQYEPQWTGVGFTKTLDTVSSVGCRNGTIEGSKFFSHIPAWSDINRFDPDFQKAVRAIYPDKCGSAGCGDDVMIVGWGASRQLELLFKIAGRDLSREGFIASTSRARNVKAPGMPELNYTPGDHFGANQVHVSEARCSDNRWHTIMSYVSDF